MRTKNFKKKSNNKNYEEDQEKRGGVGGMGSRGPRGRGSGQCSRGSNMNCKWETEVDAEDTKHQQ